MSAFREDLEAAIPALRRYARALTRDDELGDELVQDSLLRALQHEHLFNGGEVRGWLYTILTNLNRDRLRSLARRQVRTMPEDSAALRIDRPDTTLQDIERALARLAEDQRAVVLLVVLEGLSYREVAKVQGVPIGTIMSRLARARTQIRAFLESKGQPSAESMQ